MKKLEITKKECAILDYAGHVCINDGPFYEDNNVLDMDTAGENAALDHATLFLDSIQSYQECELLPSELLKQNELLVESRGDFEVELQSLQKQNKELREALEEINHQLSGSLDVTDIAIKEITEQALNSKP